MGFLDDYLGKDLSLNGGVKEQIRRALLNIVGGPGLALSLADDPVNKRTNLTIRSEALGEGTVQGVASTPGWEVLAAFEYAGGIAKLEAMMLVSGAGLTARARLFGPIGGTPAEISGSLVSTTSQVEVIQRSGDLSVNLTAGQIYQIQAECTGGSASTDFGVFRYAALTAA